MEAVGTLIESLEEEAANLRRDLERATATLRTVQAEVASSVGTLEEGERARARAQRELDALRADNSALKRRHSDEQLRLSNEHINELAAVRRRLEEQRRLDMEAASSSTWKPPPQRHASTISKKSFAGSARPWRHGITGRSRPLNKPPSSGRSGCGWAIGSGRSATRPSSRPSAGKPRRE